MKKALKVLIGVLASVGTTIVPAEPRNIDELVWRVTNKQQLSKQELDCLAQNIYHEARGEPVEGQIAVAQVTLNRRQLNLGGQNICHVVFYKVRGVCHFSWTCKPQSGRYEYQQWQHAQTIARRVADMHYTQYQYKYRNATHFHNTKVNPGWSRRLKTVKKVNNHIFYEL